MNIDRREFLKLGGVAAATFVAEKAFGSITKPEIATAEEQHWADKFIWVSPEGGIPEVGSIFGGLIEPGKTAVLVASQLRFDGIDPISESKLWIPGRKDHPVVILMTGSSQGPVTRTLTDMPTKGAWCGVFLNPDGASTLTDAQMQEAMSIRIARLRDPNLNNCTPGVGCQGPVEYVIIDGNGVVTDHGARVR